MYGENAPPSLARLPGARCRAVEHLTKLEGLQDFEFLTGLDEGFFMYWEDADWCRRATNAGFEVRFEPSLVVRQNQGASARSYPFRTIWRFHRSALIYYRAHVSRSPLETVLACGALTLRSVWKAVLELIRLPSTRRATSR